jgi:hypothetical protein
MLTRRTRPDFDVSLFDFRDGPVGECDDALTSDFLGTSEGFFGSFEILNNGNPDVFAKKFGSF